MTPEPKPWYASKTILFFALYAAVNVAALFGFGDYTPSTDQAEWIGILVSAIGAGLRFVTNRALTT